jgi:hypothetical protein
MAVKKLVFEPNDTAPTRIQIWGTFALCTDHESYGRPIAGYLYYQITPRKEEECRKEWARLQKLVGDKRLVAWGVCGRPNVDGHIRDVAEKPQSPLIFPLAKPGFTDASNLREIPGVEKLQESAAAKNPRNIQ